MNAPLEEAPLSVASQTLGQCIFSDPARGGFAFVTIAIAAVRFPQPYIIAISWRFTPPITVCVLLQHFLLSILRERHTSYRQIRNDNVDARHTPGNDLRQWIR